MEIEWELESKESSGKTKHVSVKLTEGETKFILNICLDEFIKTQQKLTKIENLIEKISQ